MVYGFPIFVSVILSHGENSIHSFLQDPQYTLYTEQFENVKPLTSLFKVHYRY